MNILSIQSQVTFGHVGNNAAILPLQRMGFEVWAVPTVLLSNHPAHGGAGALRPSRRHHEVDDCGARLRGSPRPLRRRFERVSGFTRCRGCRGAGSDIGAHAKRWGTTPLRSRVPHEDGLFVPQPVAEAVRTLLTPLASVATPNPFEVGLYDRCSGGFARVGARGLSGATAPRSRDRDLHLTFPRRRLGEDTGGDTRWGLAGRDAETAGSTPRRRRSVLGLVPGPHLEGRAAGSCARPLPYRLCSGFSRPQERHSTSRLLRRRTRSSRPSKSFSARKVG